MLIKCPECELQVSDKAYSCPHCGYPLKSQSPQRERQSNRRKRLPNGFGQISKIKNKALRNPYRAMVTVGKDPNTGRPIVRTLPGRAYYPTYNDAYEALLKYNRSPQEEASQMTVQELYEEWKQWYFPVLSPNAIENHTTAWNYCGIIYNQIVSEIRVRNIREVIDNCPKAYAKSRIKTLFSLMLDYAVEHEYTDQNYAKLIKLDPIVSKELNTVKKEHIAFTEDELAIIWSKVLEVEYADWIIMQCYLGLRPREMLGILLENVYLEKGYIIAGMKTAAGKDRVIPIHSCIQKMIEVKYNVAKQLNSPYLFNQPMEHGMSYTTYNKYFTAAIKQLGVNPDHRPHDPRKTFVTLGKKYGMDEYAIKRIVGHAIGDLTEERYTERSIEWLKEEIEKIKGIGAV